MPFLDSCGQLLTGDGEGVALRQVSANTFKLEEDFSFVREGVDAVTVEIERSNLASTDLASIPWMIRWFVARYGRHTLAALMHDQLVQPGVDNPAEIPDRRAADRLFFTSMTDLGVSVIRRQIMWAAVTARTRWGKGVLGRTDGYGVMARLGLVAWLLLAVAGITSLWVWILGASGVGSLFGWSSLVYFIVAALLPLAAMLLWGDDRQQGLVATYAFLIVVVPSVVAALFYFIYWIAETTVSKLPSNKNKGPRPIPDRPSKL